MAIDWKGLNPAPVTLFKDNGDVDFEANARLAKWLASIDGVKSLVILGHAGEGTFLTHDEQLELIRVYKDATPLPVVAGITGEGTKVAYEEAKEKYDAGATAALVYPNHGWLRFGYQKGAPQTRYEAIAQSGLECILFQYPNATKASYDLQTQLDICAIEGVTATKNGVRDMKRWYDEIPEIKNQFPEIAVMSCHDEWLLPTMFDIDGLLVGYGNMAPELLLEYLAAGKAQDYKLARKYHEQLLPITRAVYHRGSHMEGSVALKHALRARGLEAALRSMNAHVTGSAKRITRALILAEPPSVKGQEITDKGSLNINKILTRRADLLERLYHNDDPALIRV